MIAHQGHIIEINDIAARHYWDKINFACFFSINRIDSCSRSCFLSVYLCQRAVSFIELQIIRVIITVIYLAHWCTNLQSITKNVIFRHYGWRWKDSIFFKKVLKAAGEGINPFVPNASFQEMEKGCNGNECVMKSILYSVKI